MTSLIRIEAGAFGYGERPVLAGVELCLERATLVGLAGPNGSGKSTLVRGVLGLLEPVAGRVTRSTKRLGYVPQRDTLDPLFPLTALEVVRMGAYGRRRGLRGLGRAEQLGARSALARVGLEDAAARLFARLSGGQRQRVLLARALLMEPELLVLDEPTSGVDAEAEASILALLRELRDEGLGILLVSHRLEALCEVADELLWIDARQVERRAPAELLAALRAAPTRLAHGAQGNA